MLAKPAFVKHLSALHQHTLEPSPPLAVPANWDWRHRRREPRSMSAGAASPDARVEALRFGVADGIGLGYGLFDRHTPAQG